MLAVEPRLIVPRDIDTGVLCYAHITVVYLDTKHYSNESARLKAPCVLPELSTLKEVRNINLLSGTFLWSGLVFSSRILFLGQNRG